MNAQIKSRSRAIASLTMAGCAYFLPIASLGFLNSCDGGMEEAGEEVDDAVEDAGDAIEDATDKN